MIKTKLDSHGKGLVAFGSPATLCSKKREFDLCICYIKKRDTYENYVSLTKN